MWKFTRWFYRSWYQYLFEKPFCDKLTLRMVWCRVRGHPYGVGWYNSGMLEPDMTCKGCGEDLG